MQELGLDAFEETLRAGRTAVEINAHLEFFFEEKLEVHKTGQSGRGLEFDEEIEVTRIGLSASCGSEKPEIFDAVGMEFGG
jgi:hypothetical protein